MADKFKVLEGKQVVFSSDDEDLCKSIASQRKIDLMNRGCDIRNDEHRVHVQELEA